MAVKRHREITMLGCKVTLPCGCHAFALIASEEARKLYLNACPPYYMAVHACKDWKKHKYVLGDAERDLKRRMKEFLAPQRSEKSRRAALISVAKRSAKQ